jgi:formate/nitrite transporter FocA (FNT family)
LNPVAASNNLFWVTLGNMAGGMMVGVAYWFIYLRNPKMKSRPEH